MSRKTIGNGRAQLIPSIVAKETMLIAIMVGVLMAMVVVALVIALSPPIVDRMSGNKHDTSSSAE